MNCIIVEDEPLAYNLLKNYIEKTPPLKLLHICEDAESARKVLDEEHVDLIFLDVNLPRLNGVAFMKTLSGKHNVIMTTAYHKYAIDAFDMDVIDYLLKPITYERFLVAVEKARDYRLFKKDARDPVDFLFVKTNNGLEKVFFSEIQFVESIQNYIRILPDNDKPIITYSTLKNIETYLPDNFLKVQKSFIVNKDKIMRIEGNVIYFGTHSLSFSRKKRDEVLQAIIGNNVLKK